VLGFGPEFLHRVLKLHVCEQQQRRSKSHHRGAEHLHQSTNFIMCVCVCVCERERERVAPLAPLHKAGRPSSSLFASFASSNVRSVMPCLCDNQRARSPGTACQCCIQSSAYIGSTEPPKTLDRAVGGLPAKTLALVRLHRFTHPL
jgi:hypothetical protein